MIVERLTTRMLVALTLSATLLTAVVAFGGGSLLRERASDADVPLIATMRLAEEGAAAANNAAQTAADSVQPGEAAALVSTETAGEAESAPGITSSHKSYGSSPAPSQPTPPAPAATSSGDDHEESDEREVVQPPVRDEDDDDESDESEADSEHSGVVGESSDYEKSSSDIESDSDHAPHDEHDED